MFKKKPISNVLPLDEAIGDMYIPELNRAMAYKLELIKSERMSFIAEYEKEAEQFFSDLEKEISNTPLEKRSFYWFDLLPWDHWNWSMQFHWGIWPPHFRQYFVDLPPEIKTGIKTHYTGSDVMSTWQGVYSPSCGKRLDLQFVCLGPRHYFGTVSESKAAATGEGVPNDSGIYREEEIPYHVISLFVSFTIKLQRYQAPSTGYIEKFLAGAFPLSRLMEVMEKVNLKAVESTMQKSPAYLQMQLNRKLYRRLRVFQKLVRKEKVSTWAVRYLLPQLHL